MGFDFIVIVPHLPSLVASSSLYVGYLFGKFQWYFVNGCSAVSCDFGVFMRGVELTSLYSTILSLEKNQIQIILLPLSLTFLLALYVHDFLPLLYVCLYQWVFFISSFKILFIYLFIYLFIIYLFLAALSLRCCAQAFSLVAVSGSYSSLQCAGFSLWWLLAEHGL